MILQAAALGFLLTLGGCLAIFRVPDFADTSTDAGMTSATDGSENTSDATRPTSTGGEDCWDPMIECGEDCIDPEWDEDHCGGCGNDCYVGRGCVEGTCSWGCDFEEKCDQIYEHCDGLWCRCRPGFLNCHGYCQNVASDPDNCGGCDRVCGGGICENGQCVEACSDSLSNCDGECVDTLADPLHCGVCRRPCLADELCVTGGCVRAIIWGGACDDAQCSILEDSGELWDPVCCDSPWLDGPSCVAGGECPD